jgi:hypothetical protein
MRTFLRGKITLLFMTCAVLLAIPAIALADIVANDLDATVDNTAEVMGLQVGGANGTSKLYVINQNTSQGDTNNGCNLAGASNLQLDVTSSNPGVATVSPASVTIDDCTTALLGKTITVTPVSAGSTTISVARKAGTDSSAPGTFNLAPATFTVNVTPPPNTPPTVTVAGVTGGASYNKGSVPAATCQVTDTEDGNSSFAATLGPITGPYASDGIGSQEASCSYTDQGPGPGLTATASVFYNIVDPTPPVINRVVTGTLGNNGWYTSNVSVDWTVNDPESPNSLQTTGCNDQNIIADQAEQTYSCSATSAGGSSGPQSVSIKRDATDPNVSLNGGPADGQSYFFGDTPAAPTCDASDDLSGLDGACSVSGYSSAVGTHTVTATATDNAGNENTASSTYTVKPYTLNGFYQPIDMNDTVNTVKNGSTVPVKFELFKGATELTSTSAVTSIKSTPISCASLSGDPEDAIETVATGGTSLRYDTTAGQFIYNWTTPKGATQVGKCYSLTMTAADSSTITALFKLK